MQFKVEKKDHDSYLQNNFPFKHNFINLENHDILRLNIVNSSNCQNTQISNISPDSDISDLFSQSSNTINDDYKSNVNLLHEDILSSSQNVLNRSSIEIDLNSNCANNISFPRHVENNNTFNSNPSYLSTNIPGLTIIPSCNNNYMSYPPNTYQYNIAIPNGTPAQFIQCSPAIINQNLNEMPSYDNNNSRKDRYSLNQKTIIVDDDGIKRIERKRERNREAARKCRERKNQHVEVLEVKLEEQKKTIDLMQSKMKLVYAEMKRIGDYITQNLPHSDMREFRRIENEIANCLDLNEAEL